MLVRTAMAVAGFHVVSGGQWQRLVACLIGFMLARLLVTRIARSPRETHHSTAKEARHAP
jgi:F1F0 ATPase subunit 2